MVTLRAQDRLQPALLDRLTDDDPAAAAETAEARVINRSRLRESVLRDLSWLFNTSAPGRALDDSGLVYARASVLGYGLPPLAGETASTLDPLLLQQRIRQAILAYEPRILADTLSVEIVVSDDELDRHNQIGCRINGQLWAQPVPLELLLHTDIDLETGHVAVRELKR